MKNQINVVCFGEVLWDIFPQGKRAGGAPFNVAYNLSRLGAEVRMVSCVGIDSLGDTLLSQINSWDITTNGIQKDDIHPTGTVIAHFDEHNEAHYDIVENVAWDYINTKEADLKAVKEAGALVFGTLAMRNKTSRDTIFQLMEEARFNVFDINLRPPFYDVKTIKEILHKVQLAKFNKAELRLVLDFLGKTYVDEDDSIRFIQDQFDLPEIIVSKGSKGAIYYNADTHYQYPAVKIEIKDTVGSEDSFLVCFLVKRLINAPTDEIMTQATSLGAFITSKEGACPPYTLEEFEKFKAEHPIAKEQIITNKR
ncbi:MAG: carbohydrate kinase [Pseudopedobacter saltans]|uniref:Carbohydrate kinase n=1 Tax=Pseudopedobacter saltans TaxID=151895 RepID=A0A2W5GR54_9SPHI|nr:MAG: carbohydrate kinase [Pseudopedobacter saltans]